MRFLIPLLVITATYCDEDIAALSGQVKAADIAYAASLLRVADQLAMEPAPEVQVVNSPNDTVGFREKRDKMAQIANDYNKSIARVRQMVKVSRQAESAGWTVDVQALRDAIYNHLMAAKAYRDVSATAK